MANILILVGTESGNAQMVAESVQEELRRQGHAVDLVDGGDADDIDLPAREVILVCTATHGDGELPDNIIPLAESLREKAPDLAHIRYGVIGLGDRTYDTFCNGGRIMDSLLAGLGARRVGDRLEIDACTQPLPDEDAVAWVREWARLL